jgi:hypothetical protein
MEHGQPGLAFGVHPPRRDPPQRARLRLLAILLVDAQENFYAGPSMPAPYAFHARGF